MELNINIATLPLIVIIVYALMSIYKNYVAKKNEKLLTKIPLISGILGTILGIMIFYIVPEIMPTTNLIMASIIGCFSGLSATGSHQIFKQLSKTGININIEETKIPKNIREGLFFILKNPRVVSDAELALRKFGIIIRQSAEEFKSMEDVISQIVKIWGKLSEEQRKQVIKLLGV